jgi:hypothetical protein
VIARVAWRDGVHIVGTSLWCDANRPREVCFASRGDAMPTARHGQLIATAETLALLSRPGARPAAALTPPFNRPFTLGQVRLELFRSGSGLGAASLAVDLEGQRIVYAGAVHLERCDVRSCDTLVIDCEYGQPHYQFPPVDETRAAVQAFCARVIETGGVAVLLARGVTKAIELALLAAGADMPVLAHRAFSDPIRRLGAGAKVPLIRRATPKPTGGRVLLWPLAARTALSGLTLPAGSQTALVSGTALDRELVARLSIDAAFPWADRAGHQDLLSYIRASGAQWVFALGRGADAVLSALPRTCDTRALAPPQQMALF